MPKPPLVAITYAEQQHWIMDDVDPEPKWLTFGESGLHREDGPAWVIITPNGAICRRVLAGETIGEVHPMGRGSTPNYWVRPR